MQHGPSLKNRLFRPEARVPFSLWRNKLFYFVVELVLRAYPAISNVLRDLRLTFSSVTSLSGVAYWACHGKMTTYIKTKRIPRIISVAAAKSGCRSPCRSCGRISFTCLDCAVDFSLNLLVGTILHFSLPLLSWVHTPN